MRNIDEWLCNLYIEVKKIELFDFRYHEEKIEFQIPKKFLKEFEKQKKANAALINSRSGEDDGEGESPNKSKSDSSSSSSEQSDYSLSDGDVDSDLGFDNAIAEARFN